MADSSLQTTAYAVAYITFFIGISTVFLRVYCRQFLIDAWGTDDNIALFVGVSWSRLENEDPAETGTVGSKLWSTSGTTLVFTGGMWIVSAHCSKGIQGLMLTMIAKAHRCNQRSPATSNPQDTLH